MVFFIYYCIFSFLINLGFVINYEREDVRAIEWIVLAILGPLILPIRIGIYLDNIFNKAEN